MKNHILGLLLLGGFASVSLANSSGTAKASGYTKTLKFIEDELQTLEQLHEKWVQLQIYENSKSARLEHILDLFDDLAGEISGRMNTKNDDKAILQHCRSVALYNFISSVGRSSENPADELLAKGESNAQKHYLLNHCFAKEREYSLMLVEESALMTHLNTPSIESLTAIRQMLHELKESHRRINYIRGSRHSHLKSSDLDALESDINKKTEVLVAKLSTKTKSESALNLCKKELASYLEAVGGIEWATMRNIDAKFGDAKYSKEYFLKEEVTAEASYLYLIKNCFEKETSAQRESNSKLSPTKNLDVLGRSLGPIPRAMD